MRTAGWQYNDLKTTFELGPSEIKNRFGTEPYSSSVPFLPPVFRAIDNDLRREACKNGTGRNTGNGRDATQYNEVKGQEVRLASARK